MGLGGGALPGSVRVLLLVSGLGTAEPLAGQSCTRSGSDNACTVSLNGTSVTFPWAAVLATSSAVTTVPELTPGTLSTALQTVAGPTITGRANFTYTLQISASRATWNYTGGAADPSKPASHLEWRATSGQNTTFRPIGTTSAVLESNVAAGSSTSRSLEFRVAWTWTSTPPGSYSLPLVITLIAP